jgi:hypothetical protein
VIVPGYDDVTGTVSTAVLTALQSARARGARLVSICTGHSRSPPADFATDAPPQRTGVGPMRCNAATPKSRCCPSAYSLMTATSLPLPESPQGSTCACTCSAATTAHGHLIPEGLDRQQPASDNARVRIEADESSRTSDRSPPGPARHSPTRTPAAKPAARSNGSSRRKRARAPTARSSAKTSPTRSPAAPQTPLPSGQMRSPASGRTAGGRVRCNRPVRARCGRLA